MLTESHLCSPGGVTILGRGLRSLITFMFVVVLSISYYPLGWQFVH